MDRLVLSLCGYLWWVVLHLIVVITLLRDTDCSDFLLKILEKLSGFKTADVTSGNQHQLRGFVSCVPTLGNADSPDNIAILARELFMRKGRRSVATLACTEYGAVRLAKTVMMQGMWVLPARYPCEVDQARQLNAHKTAGVILWMQCSEGLNHLYTSSTLGLLSRKFNWLVWSKEPPPQALVLRVDTDLTWASPHAGMVSLLDVYQVTSNTALNIRHAGDWSKQRGLKYRTAPRNMQGVHFKAGIVVFRMPRDNLYERLTSRTERYVDAVAKQNYAVTLYLKDIINFTMELVPVNTWGYLRNGSFEGLMGLLQSGEVQVPASGLIMMQNRMGIVDYTGHVYKFRSFMMFRHPPALGLRDALLAPLSPSVWTCSTLLMTLMVVVLQFIKCCERCYDTRTATQHLSWGDSFMFAIGMATLQGTYSGSSWLSGHMLVLSAAILAVFVDAYYSGAVVSSLLLPSPVTIKNLQDLIDSTLSIGMENIGYNQDYLERSTDPLIMKLRKRKAPRNYPLDVGVQKIVRERFAFQVDVASAYPLLDEALDESDKCTFTEVQFMTHYTTYFGLPKNSPLKELYSHGLLKICETGLLQYQQRLWTPSRPVCTQRSEGSSVELKPLSPAFILLAGAMIFSLVVLLLEKLYSTSHRHPSIYYPTDTPHDHENQQINVENI